MNKKRAAQVCAKALVCAGSMVSLMAQGVYGADLLYLQGQVPMAQKAITAYGTDMFGDKVSLYDGSLHIEHSDLSLRGNSELPVTLSRQTSPGKKEASTALNRELGDWGWVLPRLGGTFAKATGWKGRNNSLSRCSQYTYPADEQVAGAPSATSIGGTQPQPQPGTLPGNGTEPLDPKDPTPLAGGTYMVSSSNFWHGTFIEVPGVGQQEVLTRAPGYTVAPQNGGSYPLVTKNHWQIGCLASTKNATGEGFYAISPSGVRYDFDWMVARDTEPVKFAQATMLRQDIHLYASKVTDRFGNWVKYNFDPANPGLLKTIESSDSRLITVTNSGGKAVSATDGTHTVSYAYTAGGVLNTVTLPDTRQWVFNLSSLRPPKLGAQEVLACDDGTSSWRPDVLTGSITHPSGATASLTTKFVILSKTDVPNDCQMLDGVLRRTHLPNYVNLALTDKKISGPGLTELRWQYAYTDQAGNRISTVSEPDGSTTRHLFGNRWHNNEGQLLSVQKGWNGSSALQTTTHTYRNHVGQPFPEQFGYGFVDSTGDWLATRNVPQDSVTVNQQGQNFSHTVTAFDGFARPVTVSKSGTGGTRSETTVYSDNVQYWVVSQIDTVTSSGLVMVDNDYNALAQPTSHKAFGVVQSTQTYNADGTLATKKFGATNNAITYSNYMRGIARNVSYPNGATESAVVSNQGLITSFTNAAGYTSGYGYDTMGRLNSITPPPGFTGTTLSFQRMTTSAYGLPAGHWLQTITKGNARAQTYFDAMWRPVMTRTFDAATEASTRKVTVTSYNQGGQVAFESYPQRDITSVAVTSPGKRVWYDALGRATRQEADSELGVLATTTDYLGGFQTRVTNPRSYATTQTMWALDKPEEAVISSISAPEGVTVSIARDAFGKPTAITRGGVTRRYVYDSGQRLCKTIEPEVGSTVLDYDLAGNVAWRAPGQALPSTSSCDQASAAAANKITYGYDTLNQLLTTTYGDGSPSVTRTYKPDGLLNTVVSNGSTWTYEYNGLRAPTTEVLNYGGQNYSFTRAYNAAGDLASLTYPSLSVAYTPNALGEPTKVGTYASSVAFHPNGAVSNYTLGNNIAHSLSLNTRGLPLVNRDAGILQDQYTYDANGNVTGIADQQENIFGRTMVYDGLDRMKTTSAPGVWGTASYTYDAADNLRTANVGSRTVTLNYTDGTNRLNSLTQNGSNVGYTYDPRGNITAKGAQTFGFDLGNRLTTSSLGGGYVYDGHGRRTKVTSTDGSTRIQVYSQDGKMLWSTSTGGSRPTSTTAYVYLGGKQIAEVNSVSGTQYVHTDGLGSPVAHSSAGGALLNRSRFEPYGFVAQGTKPSAATSLIGFTGHVQDAETDLVYMQQRYYDPIAGRFLSDDPAIADPNNGARFNRYAYALNNPYGNIDPDGRDPEAWARLGSLASYELGKYQYRNSTDAAQKIRLGTNLALRARIEYGSERDARRFELEVDQLKGAPAGVIYLRTNPRTGEQYVGRADSPEHFDARQRAHDNALDVNHSYKVIARAEPGEPLKVAEETAIRENGGPKRMGGTLRNWRHEMNDTRYRAAGGLAEPATGTRIRTRQK